MSDTDDERQRIREQKKQELRAKLENEGTEADSTATEAAPTEPIEIDGQDHLQRVIDSYQTVLVDCYADWCGPCKMLEPTIESLAAETDAAIAKVDVDRHQQLAGQLGVRGVPTLVLYANGEQVHRQSGVQQKAALESLIDRYS